MDNQGTVSRPATFDPVRSVSLGGSVGPDGPLPLTEDEAASVVKRTLIEKRAPKDRETR